MNDVGRAAINEDICATAKGYEYLAQLRARKGGAEQGIYLCIAYYYARPILRVECHSYW